MYSNLSNHHIFSQIKISFIILLFLWYYFIFFQNLHIYNLDFIKEIIINLHFPDLCINRLQILSFFFDSSNSHFNNNSLLSYLIEKENIRHFLPHLYLNLRSILSMNLSMISIIKLSLFNINEENHLLHFFRFLKCNSRILIMI